MAGQMDKINKFKYLSCKSLNDKYSLLKDINSEINSDIKNDTYKVEIKKTFTYFVSFKAFFFAIKQEREVGIPVVVRAIQIIKKLKIILYIPSPILPIMCDKKILYRKPNILTIRFDINNIIVDKTKLGILKKSPPHIKMYSSGDEKIIIIL